MNDELIARLEAATGNSAELMREAMKAFNIAAADLRAALKAKENEL